MAKVSATELIPAFKDAVRNGFIVKGYRLVSDPEEADAELQIALRALKFEESTGFWTVGAEADATILAEAERDDQKYRERYRVSDEDRQFAISFSEGIDEQVNLVLNKVLAHLFSDDKLDSFLTKN